MLEAQLEPGAQTLDRAQAALLWQHRSGAHMVTRRSRFIPLLLPALLSACASAPPREPRAAPELVETATPATLPKPLSDATLGRWVDHYVSGFGAEWGEAFKPRGYLIVARHGVPFVERSYGPARPTRNTVFHVGSLSKQFTAVGVLRLHEAGKLSLDASVREFLSELPEAFQPVTINHLLHHTAGVPDYTAAPQLEAMARWHTNAEEILKLFVHQPLAFPPGTKYAYSNSNYFLLGLVLWRITDNFFATEELVLNPAGMTSSSLASGPEDQAVGHTVNERGVIEPADPDHYSVSFAAGALQTSAADLLKWDRALAAGALLSPESERIRTTPALEKYACGVLIDSFQGTRYELHSGAIGGFDADLVRVPERDLIVAFLGNNDHFDSSRITRKVLRMILTEKPEEPIKERPVAEFDRAAAGNLTGNYQLTEASRKALKGKLPEPLLEGVSHAEINLSDDSLRVTYGGKRAIHVFPAEEANTYFTKGSGIELGFSHGGFVFHQAGFELVYVPAARSPSADPR
ncbi:MAG: serine hydrolase domain-containing protein [Polyangiaceae bacterium]